MRVILQRVKQASVEVSGNIIGQISQGWLVLLGVSENDGEDDISYVVDKILNLRLFADENDKFNLSALDNNFELLVVSQFTLFADCRKGRRPSFTDAARPDKAKKFYEQVIESLRQSKLKVETGEFQAKMEVVLTNSGPVTIFLDSKERS